MISDPIDSNRLPEVYLLFTGDQISGIHNTWLLRWMSWDARSHFFAKLG